MKKNPNIQYLHFLDDGGFPSIEIEMDSPVRIASEKAYREAYYRGACEVVKWRTPDRVAMEMAWEARKVARRKAGFWYRKEARYLYYPDHGIETARTRGFAQAMWMAAQDWDDLKAKRVPDDRIRASVILPWFDRIEQWAKQEVPVHRLVCPWFPIDYLTADQKMALGI